METYRSREVFRDGLRSVAVIESWRLQRGASIAGAFVYGSVAPMALVVTDATGTSGFDMRAQRLTREQLGELLNIAGADRARNPGTA